MCQDGGRQVREAPRIRRPLPKGLASGEQRGLLSWPTPEAAAACRDIWPALTWEGWYTQDGKHAGILLCCEVPVSEAAGQSCNKQSQ